MVMAPNILLRDASLALNDTPEPLIGRSPQMVRLREQIARLARLDTPVLISGESGTGKATVAHAIHQASAWAAKGFFPCAPAGLPQDLIGPEIFGYVRGAFR